MSELNEFSENPYTSSTAPNSTMAVVSLVSGILGWSFVPILGSIIAVITGHMAKKEIRESGGTLAGDGLATAGLILGYASLGLGLIGICIALGFLVLGLGIAIRESSMIVPLLLAVV